MTSSNNGHISYLRLLKRNRGFRKLWFAQIVSELGDWLNLVALLQMLNQYSGKAEASGLLIIIQMLPLMLFSPLAGVIADRFDRRNVMIAADLLRFAIVLGFLAVDGPDKIWLLYFLAGMQFSVTAFFEPARAALLPSLAEGEELIAANALSAVTWSMMLAVGGAVGGLISALLNNTAAFVIDAASFLVSAAILKGLVSADSIPQVIKDEDVKSNGLGPALSYLRSHPQALAVLLVKSGICLTAGGVWLLSVIYGQRVFPLGKEGAISVGLLYGAHGLGAILGANMTGRIMRGAAMNPIRSILGAFFLRSGFFLIWAFSANISIAALGLIGVASCGSLLWVLSTTLLQQLTPDWIRGRLFALENASLTLTMAISISMVGRSIDHWGFTPPDATFWTAVMALLVAASWLYVMFGWSKWAKSS